MIIFRSHSGFTLLELMLVISILAIISVSSFTWFSSYKQQTDIQSSSNIIISSLRDAQSRSISGKDFMKWGIFFDSTNNRFTLFRDEGGYAAATVKEEISLSNYIKLDSNSLAGGCDEIIFEKVTGATTQNCTIRILAKSDNSNFADITVTNSGMISN
ncbi:prepilin-type N-terminal cleavage/methylation domain-containing protein [Patescibacteria group bacterium]|nr:prepilin-type N-terminal cleavage/methylation domain-containing protein [Patescibacteria group bacterium]